MVRVLANDLRSSTDLEKESLISALCRVLREDGKRSMELVTNIIYVFFCFSNFSEFHEFLTTNKLGDMCFKIIDHEKARFQILVSDMKQLEGKGVVFKILTLIHLT